ncbi:MAG TPA: serine/threonine-protein kinase, partial [Aquabacterium sp.]|nr:serine/threonine-protein kinase [Aquabacterium sp.]
PHIVTVYDAGAGAQGTYIAMELLRGKDLRQLLAIGWRPTPGQAALIVRRVADALSYAHHKGVIHRDIKPANIFMVGRTQPRVLDFGIARIRQVESQVSDGMSRFGELVGGSPHYMAPEQVRREPVDRRADVYSLGVVLYELLTGRKPFAGSDLDEITMEVLTKAVRPPHELNPEVPQALSEIAMRAMARDLVQRTRSARTLSQELREWLDGQADVGVATVGKSGKVTRPAGKVSGKPESKASSQAAQPSVVSGVGSRTAMLAGAGTVALALLAGIAWVGWGQVSKGAVKPASDVSATSQAQPVVARPAVVAPAVVPPAAVATASAAQPAGGGAPIAVLQQPSAVVPVPVPVSPAPAPVQSPTTAAPVAAAAKPVPTGTVRLAISPWGRVFVGRRAMGVTPPLTQFSLPQGQHTITVRNDDFPAYTQTVDVKAGQSVTVTHSF